MTPEPGHGCLTSPLLDTWAAVARRAVVAGCHLLELDAEHCPLPPALAAPSTQLCLTPGWLLSLAAAVLLGLLAALALLRRMLRWLSLRDGSRAVAVAAEVAAELRKAQPGAYPSTRHAFAPAPPGAAADPLSPLLCGVCHGDITPGSTAAGVLQSCSACGLLAHNSCVRRAGKGCRPLCCAAPSLPHFWLPAGMTLDALDDVSAALPGPRARVLLPPACWRLVPGHLPAGPQPCAPRMVGHQRRAPLQNPGAAAGEQQYEHLPVLPGARRPWRRLAGAARAALALLALRTRVPRGMLLRRALLQPANRGRQAAWPSCRQQQHGCPAWRAAGGGAPTASGCWAVARTCRWCRQAGQRQQQQQQRR